MVYNVVMGDFEKTVSFDKVYLLPPTAKRLIAQTLWELPNDWQHDTVTYNAEERSVMYKSQHVEFKTRMVKFFLTNPAERVWIRS